MALTQGSIITISEINAEFDTKIDTAGAGLSKDGTSLALASLHSASGSAGPSANATPAYGATFTVPQINYDTYGRVTGHSNYTVKIPAAPSGGSATMVSNCKGVTESSGTVTLPSGGTWAYYAEADRTKAGTASGGTKIISSSENTGYAIYIRIA